MRTAAEHAGPDLPLTRLGVGPWRVGCSIVDVPAGNFRVKNLHWSKDGRQLVAVDSQDFCVCYLDG